MLNECIDEPQTTIHHQLIHIEYNTNLLVCMFFYISLRPYLLYFKSGNLQIFSSYRLLTIFRVVTSTDVITCCYNCTAKINQIMKLLEELSTCPCALVGSTCLLSILSHLPQPPPTPPAEASKDFIRKISKCVVLAEEQKQIWKLRNIRGKPPSILISLIFTITLCLP